MEQLICVLLRGVNVGGVRLKMDELRRAFATMAYPKVQTVLATGNVIVDIGRQTAGENIKNFIEEKLSDYFHYDAHVFLRNLDALENVLSASKSIQSSPDCHLYWLVCDDMGILRELNALFTALPHEKDEVYTIIGEDAFWSVPAGKTLDSAFGAKVLGDKKYKDKLTSRNINTLKKIIKVMREQH